MSITTVSEPAVLAEAKEFLKLDSSIGYAVVDSQFRRTCWGGTQVPKEIHRRLQPINSIQLRNGFPDAIIAPPNGDFYRSSRDGGNEEIPLAVIEAKGETTHSQRNATRIAISQAHSHLEDVNLAYAAVPEGMVALRDRALARELNVGLVVVSDSDVELIEIPRMVGSQSSDTADTIRFHARLGGIAVESLTKNHPKNAIGYALAVHADDEAEDVFEKYVIKSVDDARLDATALGLIGGEFDQRQLTPLGRESVRTIIFHYGGIIPALEAIEGQTGRSSRFIDQLPVMGSVARHVLLNYPPTQVLVNSIEELAEEGQQEPSLEMVAKVIGEKRPDFALDLFVSPQDRDEVVEGSSTESKLKLSKFEDGTIYSTHTTYQYKAMLYHVGLLTTRGQDKKSRLQPSEDIWALETLSVA